MRKSLLCYRRKLELNSVGSILGMESFRQRHLTFLGWGGDLGLRFTPD